MGIRQFWHHTPVWSMDQLFNTYSHAGLYVDYFSDDKQTLKSRSVEMMNVGAYYWHIIQLETRLISKTETFFKRFTSSRLPWRTYVRWSRTLYWTQLKCTPYRQLIHYESMTFWRVQYFTLADDSFECVFQCLFMRMSEAQIGILFAFWLMSSAIKFQLPTLLIFFKPTAAAAAVNYTKRSNRGEKK